MPDEDFEAALAGPEKPSTNGIIDRNRPKNLSDHDNKIWDQQAPINAQGVRLIQVKSNRDASPQEREAIQLFDGLPAKASKEVWIFRDYARAPVIKAIG